MISDNNELVLKLEEKEIYTRNLAEAIKKLSLEKFLNIPGFELKKLENLINFYNIDSNFKSNRFENIEIDVNSGFPTKLSLETLFKDKKIYSCSSNICSDISEKIKAYLKGDSDDSDFEQTIKKYSLQRYFEEIKKLDIVEDFSSSSVRENCISISSYNNNRFANYRIFFKDVYSEEAEVFASYMNDEKQNDKPKYLGTMYDKLLSYGIIPELIEKHTIGPFYTEKTGNENYDIRAIAENKNDYVLAYKNEKVYTEKKEIIKKEFIFTKKETVLERKYEPEFWIYVSSENLRLKLLDILPNMENIKVI